jgi:hypothetical protein
VNLRELLEILIDCSAPALRRTILNTTQPATGAVKPAQESLTQAQHWKALEKFLRPGDVILAEDGTSNSGATDMRHPAGCSFVTQAVWGSIGYTVGALLAALCATPERRHILFVGDGSFQLTAQELSTILRHDFKPFIFLIGNSPYTIERAILDRLDRRGGVLSARRAYTAASVKQHHLARRAGIFQQLAEFLHRGAGPVHVVVGRFIRRGPPGHRGRKKRTLRRRSWDRDASACSLGGQLGPRGRLRRWPPTSI